MLDNGFKVAIYLSDISGGFDKVDRDISFMNLRNSRVSTGLCEFIENYLAPRPAVVIVQGTKSTPCFIDNQLFQSTVLGPPLWNMFFKDVDTALLDKCFHGAKFADDLTAFKNYESSTSNGNIVDNLRGFQSHVHEWGVKHRVTFGLAKEYFCILHGTHCGGEACT